MQQIKMCGRIALIAALVALFPLALPAAGFGTLNGKVTDAKTKKPVVGAVVKIQVGKGMAAQTSKDGYYLFSNIVPTGTFNLTVSKDGYETRTVSKITITAGVKNLNISLTPKAPASPAPSGKSSQPPSPPPPNPSGPGSPPAAPPQPAQPPPAPAAPPTQPKP